MCVCVCVCVLEGACCGVEIGEGLFRAGQREQVAGPITTLATLGQAVVLAWWAP